MKRGRRSWRAALIGAAFPAALGAADGRLFAEPPPTAPTQAAAPADPWTPLKSQMIQGLALVEASVGKSVGWFVLDTGCGGIYFDESWARQSGLEVATDKPTGLAFSGRRYVRNATLEIGPARVSAAESPCTDHKEMSGMLGVPVAGILGYEFFAGRVVRIRYDEGAVDCGTGEVTPPPGSLVLPISDTRSSRVPYMTVLLRRESGRSFGVLALIDTGAALAVGLSGRVASQYGFELGQERPVGRMGGPRMVRRSSRVFVDFGKIELGPMDSNVDEREEQLDALIGAELLSRFTVILDYPRRRMILAPSKGAGAASGVLNPERPRSGCSLASTSQQPELHLTDIEPGLPADRAGAKEGDVVVAVNGEAIGPDYGSIMAAIQRAVQKDVYILRVKRGAETLDLIVDLKPAAPKGTP